MRRSKLILFAMYFNNICYRFSTDLSPIVRARVYVMEYFNCQCILPLCCTCYTPKIMRLKITKSSVMFKGYLTLWITSRRCILNIYSTNILTEYFKHAAHSPFFSSRCRLFYNAVIGSCNIHILNTECAKILKKIPAPKG